MNSRVLLVLLVAALTITAGCMGGGTAAPDGDGTTTGGGDGAGGEDAGGDDSARDSGDGDAGAGSDDGDSAGDGGTAGDGDTPDSSDGSDVGDVGELAALSDLGSFTTTLTFSGSEADETFEGTFIYRVDYVNERYYLFFEGADGPESPTGVVEYFYADGNMYIKSGEGDEAYYMMTPGAEFTDNEGILTATLYSIGIDGMTRTGTETFEGVPVARYETTDPGILTEDTDPTAFTDFSITEFEYVALVDADGIGRYASMAYTAETPGGETSSTTWEFSLTGVGATVVEDPEWLDVAASSGDA